jgi:hypothetical protein
VRALRLENEAPLGDVLRLLELLLGHRLVHDLPQLAGDGLDRLVDAVDVDAGL